MRVADDRLSERGLLHVFDVAVVEGKLLYPVVVNKGGVIVLDTEDGRERRYVIVGSVELVVGLFVLRGETVGQQTAARVE